MPKNTHWFIYSGEIRNGIVQIARSTALNFHRICIVVKIAIHNGSMFSSPTSPKYFCMELVLSVNLGPTRCVERTYKWSSILRPRQVLQLYICNHLYSVSAKGTKTKLSPSIVVTLHCSAAKKSLFQQSPPHLCTMGHKVIFKLHTTSNV